MAKRKPPPPTLAEIKAKIKAEQISRWHHSEPLFALYTASTGSHFLILSEEKEAELMTLFFFDFADFNLDILLEEISKWRTRYRKLKWTPILVFQQKYNFVKAAHFFDRYRHTPAFATIPIYMDPFGDVFEKYGSSHEPVAAIFQKGELSFSVSLKDEIESKLSNLELRFQQCLRQFDLGLPLPLVYPFQSEKPYDLLKLKSESFSLSGAWIKNASSVATEDTQATLSVEFSGQIVRCTIDLHPEARENSKMILTFNGSPIPKSFRSEVIRYDDKNDSYIEIDRTTGIYDIFKLEEPVNGTLSFRFPTAIENPIIFYDIRTAGRQRDFS